MPEPFEVRLTSSWVDEHEELPVVQLMIDVHGEGGMVSAHMELTPNQLARLLRGSMGTVTTPARIFRYQD